MVTRKAQKWLWMNRENMWLEWVLATPAEGGMAQHAAMHADLTEAVRPTDSHTTCTLRHAPSTTARAKLHAVPHGSITAHAHEQAHARARVISQRWGMHGMHGTHGMRGIDAQMAWMA